MKRTFAIGDTHGCHQTLKALLDKIGFTKNDELIMLGDYVDRGPDSKGVIDTLATMMLEGYQVEMLCGNHELMFMSDYIYENEKVHIGLGNQQTLDSFGVKSMKQIPVEYINLLQTLPYYHLSEQYILVHAGLDFSSGNPLHNDDALVWIRNWYDQIDRDWLGNRIIVHGHTPQTKMATTEQLKNLKQLPVLDIDCGAYSKSKLRAGFGNLCAFDLTNQELYFQKNIEENCIY
jgi:serine/threonine protein phosphatase 1